tara:strand:+ start:140 stop:649 length:510 start_codon:yes stop_codon:yes gene_type:complete
MSKILKIWTILQFKPHAHTLAQKNLNQQGFKTFLPLENVTKYKNQQFISTQRPLFPGYMFVAFERENMFWHKINSTYGVSKLLTHNNQPHIIPDALIFSIMARCNLEGVLLPSKKFSKGDDVRFISGPFHNFLATVENIDKNQRIWVLMDLMGQVTRTLVDADKLKYSN